MWNVNCKQYMAKGSSKNEVDVFLPWLKASFVDAFSVAFLLKIELRTSNSQNAR